MALDTNLVSYWKLEDVNDSKGSNTLTNNGTVTFSAAKINNGANFGSTNTTKYLSRTDSLGLVTNSSVVMSVSTWVKFDGSFGDNDITGIFTIASTDTQQLAFNVRGASGGATGAKMEVYCSGASGGAYAQVDYTFNTGIWYHLIWVLNGTSYTFYVNGVAIGSGTGTFQSNATRTAVTKLGDAGIGVKLSGLLDDTGVWSRALTADEVSQLFNSGRGNAYPFTATPSLYGGVAYYKLDESSGNASDSIGTNTLTNTNVTYSTGKLNNGAVYNATGDNLTNSSTIFDFQKDDAFSISFWVNLAAVGSNQFLLSNQDEANYYGWSLYQLSSGRINFDFYKTTSPSDVAIAVNTANGVLSTGWTHIVLTKSTSSAASSIKIYVNGESKSLTVGVDTLNATITYNSDLQLGNRVASYNMNGTLDEVGFWKRELSSTEVSLLYNNGLGLAYPFTSSTTSNFFQLF